MVSSETGAESASARIEDALCEILRSSLKALAAAGKADAACGLAAQACAVLRKEDRGRWGELNKLLHRLSPMTGDVGMRGDAEILCDG